MPSTTSAGTKVFVTTGAPATQTKAGYEALTFTQIKGVESLPAIGADVPVNTFQPLDGPVEKHKGPPNYGSLAMPYAHDATDAGQIIIRTLGAPTNTAQGAFKVLYSNNEVDYFQGRVFGARKAAGSATGVLMGNTTVEVNTAVVTVDPV